MSYGSPLLRPGSRVAVVSPSGIYEPERLEAGLELVRSWGLEPVAGRHLGRRHRYTAGTAHQRRADLEWALKADDIDAAWFARGGFGTAHLLPRIATLIRDDRPIVGFSDATALFSALDRSRVGRRVHGPVLHSLADHVDDDSRDALRALLLEGKAPALPGRHLAGPDREVSGRLVGGNLCVLASLAGTPWALDCQGALLVLEDIGEPAYKLDRMLTQLRLSGGLEGVRGIALGSFTGCAVPEGAAWDLPALLAELLGPLQVPVVADLPIGHGPQNRAWLHGGLATLRSDGLYLGVGRA